MNFEVFSEYYSKIGDLVLTYPDGTIKIVKWSDGKPNISEVKTFYPALLSADTDTFVLNPGEYIEGYFTSNAEFFDDEDTDGEDSDDAQPLKTKKIIKDSDEVFNVVFVFDTRDIITDEDFAQLKSETLKAIDEIFVYGKNARIYIMEQNTNPQSKSQFYKSNSGKNYFTNYSEIEALFKEKLIKKEGGNINDTSYISDAINFIYKNIDKSVQTFLFTNFNQSKIYYRDSNAYDIMQKLNENGISIGVIADIDKKYTKGYVFDLLTSTESTLIGLKDEYKPADIAVSMMAYSENFDNFYTNRERLNSSYLNNYTMEYATKILGFMFVNPVDEKIKKIKLLPKYYVIKATERNYPTLSLTITPSNAKYKNIVWTSNSKSVIINKDTGEITQVKEGIATITVKLTSLDGKIFTDTCDVFVVTPYLNGKGEVLVNNLRVRMGPDTRYSEVRQMMAGAKVNLLGRCGNWYWFGNFEFSCFDLNGEKYIKLVSNNQDGNSGGNNNQTRDDSIKLSKNKLTLIVGKSEMIPVSYKYPLNTRVTWSSSNTKVATVDSNGKVYGIKKGNVIITAKTEEGAIAKCDVEVLKASVAIIPETCTLNIGAQMKLTAKTNPQGVIVSWNSKNPAIVKVDSDGIITAIKPGTVTITAEVGGGNTAKCIVTVNDYYIKIPELLQLKLDEKVQMQAETNPQNTTITWSSNNEDVAVVDSHGNITAIKSGTAVITAATLEGASAKCELTVDKPYIRIPESLIMIKHTKFRLEAEINPADMAITWSSSKPDTVSVDENGVITAIKAGTATVTAKAKTGEIAKCKITVKRAKIKLKLKKATLFVGETKKLEISTLVPEDSIVTWISSDPKKVRVNKEGTIEAIAPGNVTVTAQTNFGVSSSCKVTVKDITISLPELLQMKTTESKKLNVTTNATNPTVTWTSSNTSIVKVNDGKLTSQSFNGGEVKITAQVFGKAATCTVQVINYFDSKKTMYAKNKTDIYEGPSSVKYPISNILTKDEAINIVGVCGYYYLSSGGNFVPTSALTYTKPTSTSQQGGGNSGGGTGTPAKPTTSGNVTLPLKGYEDGKYFSNLVDSKGQHTVPCTCHGQGYNPCWYGHACDCINSGQYALWEAVQCNAFARYVYYKVHGVNLQSLQPYDNNKGKITFAKDKLYNELEVLGKASIVWTPMSGYEHYIFIAGYTKTTVTIYHANYQGPCIIRYSTLSYDEFLSIMSSYTGCITSTGINPNNI